MEQIYLYTADQHAIQLPSCQGCAQTAQVDTVSDSASSWMRGCHKAVGQKSSHAIRHVPYVVSCKYRGKSAVTGVSCGITPMQQQFTPAFRQPCSTSCGEQQPMINVTTLKQQPIETLLDIAISLAGRSLNRTVAAFHAACSCWASAADSEAAGCALDFAEACMARTMHRMQIVQQLAVAVLASEEHDKRAVQQQRLVQLMHTLQQQYNGLVQDDETEAGEEVCSSWRPADVMVVDCY